MGVAGISDQYRGLPQFLIRSEDLRAGSAITVEGGEARHMLRARRLGKGRMVRLADGSGTVAVAEIVEAGSCRVVLRVVELAEARDDLVPVTVVMPVIRMERFEMAVAKLSELGVARILPVVTERSRFGLRDLDRLKGKVQRWRGITLESLKQSRGFRATRVDAPSSLEQGLGRVMEAETKLVLMEERRGKGLYGSVTGRKALFPAAVALGPEGGFSSDEKALFQRLGFVSAGLGSRILRSETAAIYAASLLADLFACQEKTQ